MAELKTRRPSATVVSVCACLCATVASGTILLPVLIGGYASSADRECVREGRAVVAIARSSLEVPDSIRAVLARLFVPGKTPPIQGDEMLGTDGGIPKYR